MDISENVRDFRAKKITVKELGQAVADKLKKNRYKDDPDIEAIIDDFEHIETIEDYDRVLEELYSFADCGKRIWVDTVGKIDSCKATTS